MYGDFPGSPVAKIPRFYCRVGAGSIPGRGTKIPHAVWHGQTKIKKKKKEACMIWLPSEPESHSWVYAPEEFSDKSVDMYKDIIHSIVWDSGKLKATWESVTEE